MLQFLTLAAFAGFALAAPATKATTSGAAKSTATAPASAGAITFTAYTDATCTTPDSSANAVDLALTGACQTIGSFQSFKISGTSANKNLYVFEGNGCTGEQSEAAHTLFGTHYPDSFKPLNATTASQCQRASDWYPSTLYGAKSSSAASVQLK